MQKHLIAPSLRNQIVPLGDALVSLDEQGIILGIVGYRNSEARFSDPEPLGASQWNTANAFPEIYQIVEATDDGNTESNVAPPLEQARDKQFESEFLKRALEVEMSRPVIEQDKAVVEIEPESDDAAPKKRRR